MTRAEVNEMIATVKGGRFNSLPESQKALLRSIAYNSKGELGPETRAELRAALLRDPAEARRHEMAVTMGTERDGLGVTIEGNRVVLGGLS